MAALQRFLAYAADFETTLADDDWSRLEPHFHADAVYRVESPLFGCELSGRDAIFAGMKKSLDGFDRKFSSREIATTDGPKLDGDEMTVSWTVTYHGDGLPDFVLRGSSLARIDEDGIALLVDSYDEAVASELESWMRESGLRLDPSYT